MCIKPMTLCSWLQHSDDPEECVQKVLDGRASKGHPTTLPHAAEVAVAKVVHACVAQNRTLTNYQLLAIALTRL